MTPSLSDRLKELAEAVENGGPHEWGYRDITDGTFIHDRWPFDMTAFLPAIIAALDERTALEARLAALGEERRKLDRRIHNQRVALRDNWMIVEQRMASRRWYEGWALKKLSRLCDLAGIPKRSPDGLTHYGIGKCAHQLEERIATNAKE